MRKTTMIYRLKEVFEGLTKKQQKRFLELCLKFKEHDKIDLIIELAKRKRLRSNNGKKRI